MPRLPTVGAFFHAPRAGNHRDQMALDRCSILVRRSLPFRPARHGAHPQSTDSPRYFDQPDRPWDANETALEAIHPPPAGQIASAAERLLAPDTKSTKTASVDVTAASWQIAFRCVGGGDLCTFGVGQTFAEELHFRPDLEWTIVVTQGDYGRVKSSGWGDVTDAPWSA